jgi:transcriptional regulator with XRE-family HTH domain
MSERIKRDCQCKRALHVHGTRTAYVVDKCRCRPCTDASAKVQAERSRLQAYGRYDSGRVDAQPVREHIAMLMEYGIGLKRIAALAGVSNATLGKILYGDQTRNMPPRARTEKHVADGVLAIKPSLEHLGQTVNVDATGTRRRIQALVTIGWSQSRIGELLGMAPGNFNRTIKADRVQAATARKVKEVYEELWDQPQTETDWRSKISASRSRNYAKEHGWLPPLAWDDETIDDPNVGPSVFEETPMVHGEERIGDIEFLIRSGAGQSEILSRLGFKNMGALERLCQRYGRGDVVRTMKNLRSLEVAA